MTHTFFYTTSRGAYFLISLFVLSVFSACNTKAPETAMPVQKELEFLYVSYLDKSISHLDSVAGAHTHEGRKAHFLEARSYFKMAEPVLAFVDIENYKTLNAPNILKIEEEDATDIKIKDPQGFQVMEELLFAEEQDSVSINSLAHKAAARLLLIKENTQLDYFKEYHFLWMLRDAVLRVSLTGITGFDSPAHHNSLNDGANVYKALKNYTQLYQHKFQNSTRYNQLINSLDLGRQMLTGDFDTFNRYQFLKEHVNPFLTSWNAAVSDLPVVFPFEKAIKNNAPSLFSEATFNTSYFASGKPDTLFAQKAALGKKLFSEKALSANNTMSCATCHAPEKFYTDGKKTAIGNNRNSPTLLYGGLQKAFFYDNRAGSLEGQIVAVIKNEKEFHTDLERFEKVIAAKEDYKTAFLKIYPNGVSQDNIRNAIASFIRSLASFNSKFDRNINGQEATLSQKEINGFNLFMGKAQCATCHFPPTFNGTVPVAFKESEMELLGVPQKKDTVSAILDPDPGRYDVFGTEQRKFFFKTPTVRNIAQTGPYMHNGVYETLEDVMDFYNRGGGAGIGILQEHQTLPPDPLNLSPQEIEELILFLKSLTDITTSGP